MLNIFFGEWEEAIYHPPTYFDNRYEDEWITDPLSKEMIADVDRSIVISAHLIESPVLGPISVKEISGGVKTLILMLHDDSNVFNASACGDNCAKWIFRIGQKKDLTINLRHIMHFESVQDGIPFEAYIINEQRMVHGAEDYIRSAAKYV